MKKSAKVTITGCLGPGPLFRLSVVLPAFQSFRGSQNVKKVKKVDIPGCLQAGSGQPEPGLSFLVFLLAHA